MSRLNTKLFQIKINFFLEVKSNFSLILSSLYYKLQIDILNTYLEKIYFEKVSKVKSCDKSA